MRVFYNLKDQFIYQNLHRNLHRESFHEPSLSHLSTVHLTMRCDQSTMSTAASKHTPPPLPPLLCPPVGGDVVALSQPSVSVLVASGTATSTSTNDGNVSHKTDVNQMDGANRSTPMSINVPGNGAQGFFLPLRWHGRDRRIMRHERRKYQL